MSQFCSHLFPLQSSTSTLYQISAESALFSTTNLRVLQTEEVVRQATNQSLTLAAEAADWSRRSTAVEQKTLQLQLEEDRLFTEAQNTLVTLGNFEQIALGG